MTKKAWHALSIQETLTTLHATLQGLSEEEAETRLAKTGPNCLPPPKRRSGLVRFLLQFHNILIYILLLAALGTCFMGDGIDTAVIFGVVIINALIGFIQEGKAERALEAIQEMLSPSALILRDGTRVTVPTQQLVPGDIVLLKAGNKVPADLRLLSTKNLRVQESILTGESLPVEKQLHPVSEKSALGERSCMTYSGTLVTYGLGTGVVVETGEQTEIGRINQLLAKVPTLTTPLIRQMSYFARWLTFAIVILAVFTFVFGFFFRHYPLAEMFLAAVGLAVSAIPEGLPAIMTITLAIGVTRMARRNAIIRRLPAVETMGAVSVICTDKTGTLTRNELSVETIVTADQTYRVTGSGYNNDGQFLVDDQMVPSTERNQLSELLLGAILCNDADLIEAENAWRLQGDPIDGALLAAGLKAGLTTKKVRNAHPRDDLIPFESEHKFMASLHHDHEGHRYVFIKGAPERVLSMCDKQRNHQTDVPLNNEYWKSQSEMLATQGQRVLALAACQPKREDGTLQFDDVTSGLTLLGLFGLIDPPRTETMAAVKKCQQAGIVVKMITGDHAITAHTIGTQVGIGNHHGVLTGHEIDQLDDEALAENATEFDIYARTTPEHKLRLVRALQSRGAVVAMTGDGVNDAPALRQAEIGIAMGIKGTEATKEAAEMVLTDDNFASIEQAVNEGRTVYDNIKKAILYILPTSFGEAFTIIIAILLGQLLPLTPVQILWINMVTTVTLAIALAFEPAETDVMSHPPRSPSEPLLSRFLVWRILFVTVLLVISCFGLFLFERAHGATLATARTVVVNMLVVGEAIYLINCRRLVASTINLSGFFGNRIALLAIALVLLFQMFFTYLPVMQHFFASAALNGLQWLRIVITSIIVFILVEVEKWWRRRP